MTRRLYLSVGVDSQALVVARPEDDEAFLLEGRPLATGWKPRPLALVASAGGDKRPVVDVPWFSDRTLVVTEETKPTLGALVEPHGELLPVTVGKETMWLFHPTTTRDILDLERSKLEVVDGLPLNIEHYEFTEVPTGPAIFALGNGQDDTLFTQAIVDQLLALKLTGLKFEPLP